MGERGAAGEYLSHDILDGLHRSVAAHAIRSTTLAPPASIPRITAY
jgi:hypothetical protein